MTNNLVYKFVRALDDFSYSSDVNFLCKDNYIHIRLKRFGHKKEHLVGFESKLTFLLTLMMNNAINHHITTLQAKLSQDKENYKRIWENCLECLKSTTDYILLENVLRVMFKEYKGLKILPMYSLKYKPDNAFDLLGECYGLPSSTISLDYLLRNEIKDDLYGFLFDNNIEVYIETKSNIDNSKFTRKHSKQKKEPYINLWAD